MLVNLKIIIILLLTIFFSFKSAHSAAPISILDKKHSIIAEQDNEKSSAVHKNKANMTIKKRPQKKKLPDKPSATNDNPKKVFDVLQDFSKKSEVPKKLVPTFARQSSVIANIEQNLSRTSIKFLWDKPVKAAAFVVQEKLWIIFDSISEVRFIDNSQQFINSRQSDNPYSAINIYNIAQQKLNNRSTFVVADIQISAQNEKPNIFFYKNNNHWTFEISQISNLSTNIKIEERFFKNVFPYIEINTGERFYESIDYRDPFTNQDMSVIPLENSSSAIKNSREFIDLHILKTIHGIAIKKISSDIKISALNQKSFVITKKAGLNIAPEIYLAQHNDVSHNLLRSSVSGILNPVSFISPSTSFDQSKKIIMQKIMRTKPSFKSRAKLELAMLYFANGFYNEALTLLDLASNDDPILSSKYQVQLFSAVLEFFTRNYKNALDKIKNIDIKDVPEIHLQEFRFWQSLIVYSNIENYEYIAFSNISKLFMNLSNNFLRNYTDSMKIEIGLTIIEYKIRNRVMEDIPRVANVILDNLKSQMNSISINRFNYDIGLFNYYNGNYKSALGYFEQCTAKYNDNLHYNKCYYRRNLLLYDMKEIDKNTLIESLERVKMRWKGGNFEIELLSRLYDLYMSNSSTINALRIGQYVLDDFKDTIHSVQASNRMSKDFIDFFLTQKSANADPIQALDIFLEFQHLLPIGDIGDEIILRVADYLEKIDLIDQHIILLEHQVNYRLTGIKRERAVNKLALAYLKNLQPSKILQMASLKAKNFKIPELMLQERKYILARSLQKLGKNAEVIKLLQDDSSQEADEIRSEIFWQKKDWRTFNDFSEPYLYSIMNQKTPLTDKDGERLLRQMISYFYLQSYDLLDLFYHDFKHRITDNNQFKQSIKLLYNITQAQKIRENNDVAFDVEEIYQLTSEMINSLNAS